MTNASGTHDRIGSMNTMDQPDRYLYADRLARVTNEAIRIRWYYGPFVGKTLPLAEIERIEIFRLPGHMKWLGRGAYRTHWAFSFWRQCGPTTYILVRRSKCRIAFSVVDNDAFQAALAQAGVALGPGDAKWVNEASRQAAWFTGLLVAAAPVIAGATLLVLWLLGRI